MSNPGDEFLDTTQAAALLHMSPKTMTNRRRRGESMPPMYRVGKRVLYRRTDLDAWLEAQREDR